MRGDATLPFSPHAWGWSGSEFRGISGDKVLPTRVGMVRKYMSTKYSPFCSPHTRGDGPFEQEGWTPNSLFSPHAWGWSDRQQRERDSDQVLPTRVGMVRMRSAYRTAGDGSPHTRGDGPKCIPCEHSTRMFSPHAWGWSERRARRIERAEVLPTRVGMVRCSFAKSARPASSPHTRGDGPKYYLLNPS